MIVHGKGKKRQSFADVKRKREDKDKASNLIKVQPNPQCCLSGYPSLPIQYYSRAVLEGTIAVNYL